jgi:hypothetical protein
MTTADRSPLVALLLVTLALPAQAVTLGQTDTFETSIAGWRAGGASPLAPAVQQDGGPDGVGDAFMLLQSFGTEGAGGRLVVFNTDQWAGDYRGAGITGITLDLVNFGNTDLALRLRLSSNGGIGLSTLAANLPANSGWTQVYFSLSADALGLSASVHGSVLADVQELRLFHATTAAFPGEFITATLGVDNIAAVPLPPAVALMSVGLVALATRQRKLV